MHTILSSTLPPAQALLVVLGFAGLICLLFLVVKVTSLKMSGWKVITERFPMRDVSFTGDSFRKQDGVIGDIGLSKRGFLDIRLASEGVCIYPLFGRHKPCLIPWSAIRRVTVSDTSLHIVVNYEQTFEFFMPIEALPTVQTRLSPELFHKSVSPFEVAKATLKDGAQPGWMTALAGGAVKLVEKEYEKEKRKHDDVV